MDGKMKSQRQENYGLKMIVVLLVCLLCGSFWYNYKQTDEIKTIKITDDKMIAEKTVLLSDLEKQKIAYDVAIKENSTLNKELADERTKVMNLINEVKKSKGGDISGFVEIKKKYSSLEQKYNELMLQNQQLKKQNTSIKIERDSTVEVLGKTNVELGATKKTNDELVNQNTELTNKIKKASYLSVVALQAKAFKVKQSGKVIDTEKASATDMLKISFVIAQNEMAEPDDKIYYIQVIDVGNNVIGDKISEVFETQSLTYSAKIKVKYNNKTINVMENILVKNLPKGIYNINLFDQKEVVSNATFTLK